MTAIVPGQSTTLAPPSNAAAHPAAATIAVFTTAPQDDTLIYGSLQHDEYRLRHPIRLALSVRDGRAVVSWDEAGLIASGVNLDEALTAFRSMVIDRSLSADVDDVVSRYVERVYV